MTDAESAPGCCEMTGTPARSPQACTCSIAAALNVSPAAIMTERPSVLRHAASLPMVVVFPAPLTPTTRMTYGPPDSGTRKGRSTGASISSMSVSREASSVSTSRTSRHETRDSRLPMMRFVASTPTSADRSIVSTSSRQGVVDGGARPDDLRDPIRDGAASLSQCVAEASEQSVSRRRFRARVLAEEANHCSGALGNCARPGETAVRSHKTPTTGFLEEACRLVEPSGVSR